MSTSYHFKFKQLRALCNSIAPLKISRRLRKLSLRLSVSWRNLRKHHSPPSTIKQCVQNSERKSNWPPIFSKKIPRKAFATYILELFEGHLFFKNMSSILFTKLHRYIHCGVVSLGHLNSEKQAIVRFYNNIFLVKLLPICLFIFAAKRLQKSLKYILKLVFICSIK